MKPLRHYLTALLLLIAFNSVSADENRYQAHWNGSSYLIIDSDEGHMWTKRNDSLIYNGQLDGDSFIPPELPQIWQQKHGRWTQDN